MVLTICCFITTILLLRVGYNITQKQQFKWIQLSTIMLILKKNKFHFLSYEFFTDILFSLFNFAFFFNFILFVNYINNNVIIVIFKQ